MVFRSVVANYTRGVPFIWNEIPVLLTFDSNWEKAKELLDEIGHGYVDAILDEAAEERVHKASNHYLIQAGKLTPMVYTSVKENGILLTLRYLCEPRKRRDSTHLIWERVLQEFAHHADIRFVNQPVFVVAESQNA
jgi:small-conductance mechanosensitive channel